LTGKNAYDAGHGMASGYLIRMAISAALIPHLLFSRRAAATFTR
jgi:hypothetical protein